MYNMYVYILALCAFSTQTKVQKLTRNEVLMVNIGSLSTGGRVSAVKADLAKIVLTQPVCTEVGEKIALSRRVEKHWRSVIQWIITNYDIIGGNFGTKSTLARTELIQRHSICHGGSYFQLTMVGEKLLA